MPTVLRWISLTVFSYIIHSLEVNRKGEDKNDNVPGNKDYAAEPRNKDHAAVPPVTPLPKSSTGTPLGISNENETSLPETDSLDSESSLDDTDSDTSESGSTSEEDVDDVLDMDVPEPVTQPMHIDSPGEMTSPSQDVAMDDPDPTSGPAPTKNDISAMQLPPTTTPQGVVQLENENQGIPKVVFANKISPTDAQDLRRDNNALWVNLSTEITTARATIFKKLYLSLTQDAGRGSMSVSANRQQFLIIQYVLEKARDRARRKLLKRNYVFGATEVPIAVKNYGDGGNAGPYTYILSAGTKTTDKTIQTAVSNVMRTSGIDTPAYSIRNFTINKKHTGVFYCAYEEAPRWGKCKTLQVGTGGEAK